jgi:hypothetical protein
LAHRDREPGSAPLIGDEQRTDEYHEMKERQASSQQPAASSTFLSQ